MHKEPLYIQTSASSELRPELEACAVAYRDALKLPYELDAAVRLQIEARVRTEPMASPESPSTTYAYAYREVLATWQETHPTALQYVYAGTDGHQKIFFVDPAVRCSRYSFVARNAQATVAGAERPQDVRIQRLECGQQEVTIIMDDMGQTVTLDENKAVTLEEGLHAYREEYTVSGVPSARSRGPLRPGSGSRRHNRHQEHAAVLSGWYRHIHAETATNSSDGFPATPDEPFSRLVDDSELMQAISKVFPEQYVVQAIQEWHTALELPHGTARDAALQPARDHLDEILAAYAEGRQPYEPHDASSPKKRTTHIGRIALQTSKAQSQNRH